MSLSQAKSFLLREIEALGTEYSEFEVQFMGGEPLMAFPMLKNLSEWLWKQSFHQKLSHIFVVTNGTLVDETNKKWFSDNKERFCLGLSFDGNRLMQDLNRSCSSHRVDLDFFVKTWPRQTVKVTISPKTLPLLAEGIRSLHQAGFASITADLAMGMNVEWGKSHLALLNQQLHLLMDYYLQEPSLHPFSLLDIDVERILLPSENIRKRCGCGEDLVCVDCDGTSYACHLFSPVAISETEARWIKENTDFHNHKAFVPNGCERCLLYPACTVCSGMNYICNKDIQKQLPFTCQSFKMIFMACCEFQLRLAKQSGNTGKRLRMEKIVKQIIE